MLTDILLTFRENLRGAAGELNHDQGSMNDYSIQLEAQAIFYWGRSDAVRTSL